MNENPENDQEQDKEQRRQYARKRYNKLMKIDPEKIQASTYKWRDENREAYNAYMRDYRKKHPSQRDLKRMALRKQEREARVMRKEEDYQVQRINSIIRRQECKAAGVTPLTQAEISDYVRRKKTGKSCMDCKGSYPPELLDFDHKDPTEKVCAPSQMTFKRGFITTQDIDRELAKCDLVCPTCHRVRTLSRPFKKKGKKSTTASIHTGKPVGRPKVYQD